jgi:stringent starvation protein B
MNSSRPYLVRALIEWITDSQMTPYIAIAVDSENVDVPSEYVTDQRIVLNVSSMAVRDFAINQEEISFFSKFNGVSRYVKAPTGNVIAVYSKESGEGMQFDIEASASNELLESNDDKKPTGGPSLKLV